MNRWTRTALVAGALAIGAPAAHAAGPAPCGTSNPVPGALCGTVAVPLDRAAPAGPTIEIGYELYPSEGQSSAGITLALQGGPGLSTTATRD